MTKQGDRLILSVSLSNMIASMSVFTLRFKFHKHSLSHKSMCIYIYICIHSDPCTHIYFLGFPESSTFC